MLKPMFINNRFDNIKQAALIIVPLLFELVGYIAFV